MIELGPFATCAASLTALGYVPVPIMPGSKKPGYWARGRFRLLHNWTDPAALKALPDPGAHGTGLGVLCGAPSGGLIAVDIDTADPAIHAALIAAFPPTPVRKIGAKGETLFYRCHGAVSHQYKIDGKLVVEVLATGRQTILPPTVHPDTRKPYRWSGEGSLEATIPEIRPRELHATAELALEPFGYTVTTVTNTGNGDNRHRNSLNGGDNTDNDTPWRQLNEAALDNLDAWVPDLGLYNCRRVKNGYQAVPKWRPSSTGRPLEIRDRNLGISPKGIKDFGAGIGHTPIDLVMLALDFEFEEARVWLDEQLGWSAGGPEVLVDRETGEIFGEGSAESHDTAAGDGVNLLASDPLDAFTHPPGLLGEVIGWICNTARRPNRVLALGAAIVTIGTLIGRRAAGPTRSGAHLYVVNVAPAASGKDHPLNCVPKLLKAAGAGAHVKVTDITAQTAFNKIAIKMPLGVVVIDEIADFLGRIARSKNAWERGLVAALRTQWGKSFQTFGTTTSAEHDGVDIESPAISLFGAATREAFWEILQGAEVRNGLFSRFLVLTSDYRAQDCDPLLDPSEVPPELARRLSELFRWNQASLLVLAQLNDPNVRFRPDVLDWEAPEAAQCWRDLVIWKEAEIDSDISKQEYFGRLPETAIRLATICAAGRGGPSACVSLADMEWGAGLAKAVVVGMMERSIDSIAQTPRGELTAKILELIRRAGDAGFGHGELHQKISGRVPKRELEDIIKGLIEANLIEVVKAQTGVKGGRPSVRYKVI